jgi:hypothetical protein
VRCRDGKIRLEDWRFYISLFGIAIPVSNDPTSLSSAGVLVNSGEVRGTNEI